MPESSKDTGQGECITFGYRADLLFQSSAEITQKDLLCILRGEGEIKKLAYV